MTELFRSAVFKLTAVYVAIVMTISVVFSLALHKLAVQELQLGFQNQYVRWLTEYKPFGLRQPGNPAAELAARSENIASQLIYLNLLVFAVTAVASYILARRTLRPIEAAHEQQKRFTADVSHELRTPLTSIKMETEVALMDAQSSKQELKDTLRSNLEEVQRMEGLINNLLQLASLEANQIRTEFERLDIRDLTQAALKVVGPYATKQNIMIDERLQAIDIYGDRSSLTQLCIILIENAIKYSPGGSSITVTTLRKNMRATVEIRDRGVGIAPEALPHVFDRFYRSDSARSEQAPHGYGLGLSLAKLIADIHDAEITLTSHPGKGTVARVHFVAAAPRLSPLRSRSNP
ncbi:MAG TPA: ATP-binding protein [Candidatus Limnocylindrales bacterium]|nr:ATP-binding protein [Candidatus Limnocylindrales bacterium]